MCGVVSLKYCIQVVGAALSVTSLYPLVDDSTKDLLLVDRLPAQRLDRGLRAQDELVANPTTGTVNSVMQHL